ncbi:aminophospholipid translocase [Anaeromyces robustus]|uniref:Phospholipid-transporting ATPase n=1 Tax=Anaeromyces robustus TaxID=1754192 RepID=A0A1Y1VWT4_9FUNG|nr:aminophospholipid translocase [Anaeromyces robustus]|eukprot:ORX65446.1 aminophospholipid translocase [Anaeromyces robustus]
MSKSQLNEPERIIYLNDSEKNLLKYKKESNYISTSKYTIYSFIFIFLKEQFSKYANVFFLFTALLQQIPNVSPTNRWTTAIPLVFVLSVTAVKEIFEDYKRHKTDNEVNNRKIQVIENNSINIKTWNDVKVGDIVRVENDEYFPADLILLSSSEPDTLCYIETSNLDGETNLKIKQGLVETSNILTPELASQMKGLIKSEQPNNRLYNYDGVIILNDKSFPLDPTQLLLRGAKLKNTQWIYGVVITTGHNTKLLRNSNKTPIKKTSVEHMTNYQIVFLFGILLVLSLTCTIGYFLRQDKSFEKTVLHPTEENSFSIKDIILGFLTFIVLYNNLIPISLIVTMEFVKYCISILINNDMDMYYDVMDTTAQCRTSSLVEELGQVEYIFSDKTGTLTCNIMEFKKCSIAGEKYTRSTKKNDGPINEITFDELKGDLKDADFNDVIYQFVTLLSVCHTVIPEQDENDPSVYNYQASSPDEGALVKGALLFDFKFTTRKPHSVIVNVNGQDLEYEILNVCEFNSTRKRMSTIVKCPNGEIKIYCKGADTVIFERLAKNGNIYMDKTIEHLEEYASEGLRTLCLATRTISPEEYETWSKIFDAASTTLVNREEELSKAAELIEKDLFLLGATAIEDKLQDGIPETITTLSQAGIKIWILTGDKQETAINIGLSCQLINNEMELIIFDDEVIKGTSQGVSEFIDSQLSTIKQKLPKKYAEAEFPPKITFRNKWIGKEEDIRQKFIPPTGLVIDGKMLEYALRDENKIKFLELATLCQAVICCRVSPLQKALVVKLVKNNIDAITLAIGDGANDVGMIQAAHVGVGINGMEGLQAARAADFAISQFRFLRKLLLVHGSWAYSRLSKLILYSFYKNLTLYLTQFWYSFNNGFSGQTIYESWTLTSYNVIFTVFPPIVMGFFDQFLNAIYLNKYPKLYKEGFLGKKFNISLFVAWALNGIYHSLLLYLLIKNIWFESQIDPNGDIGNHWMLGSTLFTCVLGTVLLKAGLTMDKWNKYTTLAIVGSYACWIILLPIYCYIGPLINLSPELDGMEKKIYSSSIFWFSVIIIPCVCIFRDYIWKFMSREYFTTDKHVIQEMQKYIIDDYSADQSWYQKAVGKVKLINHMRKSRGFAFSQLESGPADIIRIYDTTKRKPSGK